MLHYTTHFNAKSLLTLPSHKQQSSSKLRKELQNLQQANDFVNTRCHHLEGLGGVRWRSPHPNTHSSRHLTQPQPSPLPSPSQSCGPAIHAPSCGTHPQARQQPPQCQQWCCSCGTL